jgi:hypothetical protein
MAIHLCQSPGSLPAQVLRLRRAVEAFAPDAVITFLRGATLRFGIVRAASHPASIAALMPLPLNGRTSPDASPSTT